MPLYDIACQDCGATREVFRIIAERHDLPACDCGGAQAIVVKPTMVRSDIEPYRAIATDIATGKRPTITSRSEHREFLKRNGLIEVGNSTQPKPPAPDSWLTTKQQDRARAQAVKQAIDEVRTGARRSGT
jgi:putative FmdB family regulatory protein